MFRSAQHDKGNYRFTALTIQLFNEYTKQHETHRHDRTGSARPVEDALEDVLRFSG